MGIFNGLRHGQQFAFAGAPIGLISMPAMATTNAAVGTRKANKSKEDEPDKYQGLFAQQEILEAQRGNLENADQQIFASASDVEENMNKVFELFDNLKEANCDMKLKK